MQYIQFKTDMREIEYAVQGPKGRETRKEQIPVATGLCPKCGAILFGQEGMIGETLHKIALQQMENTAAHCHNCGENYCVGPIIDAQYEVINEEVVEDEQPSREDADTSTENK